MIAAAEQVTAADLVGVDLVFLEGGEFGAGVGNPFFQGLALFSRQVLDLERRAGGDTDLGKARQQVFFTVLGAAKASMKFR